MPGQMPNIIDRFKAAKDAAKGAIKAGPVPQTPEKNPFSLKRYPPGTRKVASFGLMLFVLGLAIAAAWAPGYWALSTLCSSAFMAVGWGIGFLFGVPRTSASDTSTNTNLEQISDWLTKVLVGVGLTELAKLPTKLASLASYIAAGYKSSASNESTNNVFALSMFLYFSSLGFLIGYLLTRLALQSELNRAGGDDGTTTSATTTPLAVTALPATTTAPATTAPDLTSNQL